MVRHLFFDLDRTLWDFERNSETALRLLFFELGLDKLIVDFDEFHAHYKENNSTLWKLYGKGKIKKEILRDERFRITLKTFNIHDESIVQLMSNGYVGISPQQTHLFPAATETLDILAKEGYQMHIITNGFLEVQHVKLKKANLHQYFDLVLCSEEVGHNKPSPEIFKQALKITGANAFHSVMIGDDYEVDILGAQNCGMHGILFDPNREMTHVSNDYTIQHLGELPQLLPWIFKTTI